MKILIILFGILISTVPATVQAQTELKFEQEAYQWNLRDIYPDNEAWNHDYLKALQAIDTLKPPSHDITNGSELSRILNELTQIRKLTSKVAYYGMLKYEEAIDKKGMEMNLKGERLLSSLDSKLALYNKLFYKIGPKRLNSWVQYEEKLFPYRFWINQIIDQSEHQPIPEVESLLRKISTWSNQSIDLYWEVLEMDNIWTKYTAPNGESRLLNRSEYKRIRKLNPPEQRNPYAEKYYESLGRVVNLMGQLYSSKIEKESSLAEIRNFKSGIDASWFMHAGVPEGTFLKLLEVARNNRHLLHGYARLRAKLFDIDTLHYLDFFKIPEELADVSFDFKESMEIAQEASKTLGKDFESLMMTTLKNTHWHHLADVPKNSQYHIHPPTGDEHPYFILRYKPALTESRALVGGLFDTAHSIPTIGSHGTDVVENTTDGIYGIIYTGDLLFDQLKAAKINKGRTKAAFLMQHLEFMRRFFKNVVLLELDYMVQQKIASNEVVTGEKISEWYLNLLRDYYGHDLGVVHVPDYLQYDWISETHVLFMPKFEHHFWAPSLALGATIIESKKKGDSKIDALILGMDDIVRNDSYSKVLKAGIDLNDVKFYTPLFDRMQYTMNQVSELLKYEIKTRKTEMDRKP